MAGITGKQIRDLRSFKDSESSPLATIRDGADVTVGKKDDALTVGYESPFKNEASIIVNAIVRAFIKYQTLPKQSNINDVFEHHLAEKQKIEAELNAVTEKMGEVEQKYGILSSNSEENFAYRQFMLLAQQLAAAHTATLQAKVDYDEAARALPDPRLIGARPNASSAISAQDEQVLRAELLAYQNKLEDVQARYLPDHPAVKAIQAKADQAAANYAEAVRRRFVRTKSTEDDLAMQVEQQKKRANEVNSQAASYGRLKDEATRLRHLIDTLDTRIHGIDLQQSGPAVDIDFFDPADASSVRKSHPSKSRALAMALALGLVIGCGTALLRDWADDRLHTADEIKSSLGMPLLGAVPHMPKGIDPIVAGQTSAREPSSEVAEAYRAVRTALYFGAPKDRSKTVLITSPSSGDGKSTSAANLACVMAHSGKKILLIDADLRSPSLDALFELSDNRVGLSSLLNGQGTWERAIQPSGVSGLDVLPSGPMPRNPSEMLNSPMFCELLELLAEKYDQILIDSPPVMGLADARIIAASCDLTLLVLRADKSTRKLAMLARDGLVGVGANVLGVIVTDVARRSEGAYGSGYHSPSRPRQASDVEEGDLDGLDESTGDERDEMAARTDLIALPKRDK